MSYPLSSISTLQMSLLNRRNISDSTLALQRAGQEVSSGRKADIFADLGPQASSALRLRASEADTQTFQTANSVLDNKLQAMLTSVNAVRDRVDAVLETVLTNATEPRNGAEVLQDSARAALEGIVSTLNTSYNGEMLFSGLRSDTIPLTRWETANPDTGLSPQDVMVDLFGTGPTDAASATAIADAIDLAFNSLDGGNPNRNFEATFYSGSPELDGAGQPTKQVNAFVNTGQEVVYGVRANDPAFRDAIKGLAMLAVTDVSEMDEAAYVTYMDRVATTLSGARDGMLQTSARIGFNQEIVETAQVQLNDLSLVQRTQISNYENVDPYEAVTRMRSLETQLQASYEVTARMSQLSFLNFMR